MNSVDRLKLEMTQAQESLAEASRRMAGANEDLNRCRAELARLQQAYLHALEQELAARPRPEAVPDVGVEQWDDPGPDFPNLVIQAGSRTTADRVVAQRALDRMGPKAIEPLLAMLSLETARWERRITVVCGVLVTLTVAAMLQLPALAGFPEGYWLMLLCIPALVLYAKPFGPHKRAAEALARVDNIRVIGPLIAALDLDDPVVVPSAADALKRLLRRIGPDDSAALTESHWATLFRAIDRTGDEELATAALLAVEQVGDERAIPFVAPLESWSGVSMYSEEVRREARACLQLLADQSLRGRPGRTLLRAVAGPVSTDALLRAASNAADTNQEALLRPSGIEEPV
jgi:HEAT repeat protein